MFFHRLYSFVFFFKQKTAYEMRISDWSSDVCLPISGSQAPILYVISILVVLLSLAALYESWSIPFSVIMVVPLGIIGALLAATGRGLSNDVYFQVGLLTTVGLSAKNAILIVEFARALQAGGMTAAAAAMEAEIGRASCRERVCQYV